MSSNYQTMIEFLFIIITVVVFLKASKNKPYSFLWGFVGFIYYGIGRILFSVLLYAGYRLFMGSKVNIRFHEGIQIIELTGGIVFGLLTAYILGELSGVNIRKALKNQ